MKNLNLRVLDLEVWKSSHSVNVRGEEESCQLTCTNECILPGEQEEYL